MRTLIAVGAIALGSLSFLACSPPLSESMTWAKWVAENVTQQELLLTEPIQLSDGTLFNRAAVVDVLTSTVYFDYECAGDGVCFQNFEDQEWWRTHEFAHVAYWELNVPWGADLASNERGAQCIAEVILGRSVTASPVESYWDCPSWQVESTRQLMRDAGMVS